MKKIFITAVCFILMQDCLLSQNIYFPSERDRFNTMMMPNQVLNNRFTTSPFEFFNTSTPFGYNTFIPNTLYTPPLSYGNLYTNTRDFQINSFDRLNTNIVIPVPVIIPVPVFSQSLPGLSNLPGTQPNIRITINHQ